MEFSKQKGWGVTKARRGGILQKRVGGLEILGGGVGFQAENEPFCSFVERRVLCPRNSIVYIFTKGGAKQTGGGELQNDQFKMN